LPELDRRGAIDMAERADLQKQLQSFRETKWIEVRVKRLARWPGRKRAALRELITPSDRLYGESFFGDRVAKVRRYFEGLDEKKRQEFWRGLFGQLAPHLERAWCDAGRRPYQFGYSRLPFRAPHRVETTALSRARFFVSACQALHGFDRDAEWLAAWAPHIPLGYYDPRVLGWILGSILRGGGPDAEAVRSVLVDSINGRHEIGEMGRHAVVAFLNSEAREDWEIMGKLLLAAQRQEGLRQAILEAVDEASPNAFRYMLGITLEHDLARFSAVVRAFDVWLGTEWAGGSAKVVSASIRRLCEFFDDDDLCTEGIQKGEPEDAYLALWVTAYQDAEQALKLAAPLLEEPSPERRFAGLKTVERLLLFPECLELVASRFVAGSEDDPRLQMAIVAYLSRLEFTSLPMICSRPLCGSSNHCPPQRKSWNRSSGRGRGTLLTDPSRQGR